jgi:biotin carboxyl carrier protein
VNPVLAELYEPRTSRATDIEEFVDPTNGRLVAVAVEDGRTVEAVQRLAIIEAIKVEHTLVAIIRVEAEGKTGSERQGPANDK